MYMAKVCWPQLSPVITASYWGDNAFNNIGSGHKMAVFMEKKKHKEIKKITTKILLEIPYKWKVVIL